MSKFPCNFNLGNLEFQKKLCVIQNILNSKEISSLPQSELEEYIRYNNPQYANLMLYPFKKGKPVLKFSTQPVASSRDTYVFFDNATLTVSEITSLSGYSINVYCWGAGGGGAGGGGQVQDTIQQGGPGGGGGGGGFNKGTITTNGTYTITVGVGAGGGPAFAGGNGGNGGQGGNSQVTGSSFNCTAYGGNGGGGGGTAKGTVGGVSGGGGQGGQILDYDVGGQNGGQGGGGGQKGFPADPAGGVNYFDGYPVGDFKFYCAGGGGGGNNGNKLEPGDFNGPYINKYYSILKYTTYYGYGGGYSNGEDDTNLYAIESKNIFAGGGGGGGSGAASGDTSGGNVSGNTGGNGANGVVVIQIVST